MDFSDIEEPLSAIVQENDIFSANNTSEVENLDAIKKFIEQQEKEILEMELAEKKKQEEKSKNKGNKSDNKQTEDNQGKKIQEILGSRTTTSTEGEMNSEADTEFNVTVGEKSDEDMSKIEINELLGNADQNCGENMISSSVMNMILSESEDNMTENHEIDIKDESKLKNEGSQTPSQKIITTSEKGNSSNSLSIGCKVEVKSFEGEWYAAEVAEVDYDEMEVLVRYEIELKKSDEWVSVNSSRLRPYTGNTTKPTPVDNEDKTSQNYAPTTSTDISLSKEELVKEIKEEPMDEAVKVEDKPKIVFEVGERCLARWRDNRRFCATIHKDLGDGKFEIIFDDGFHWTCSQVRLHKMKSETLSVDTSFHADTAGSPSPLAAGPANSPASPALPAYHTHLFDPTRDYLGSKSERREKKRKLNIKEIFNIGQKKYKKQKTDESPKTENKPTPKRPTILRKSTPKAPKVPLKKENTSETAPDAVASIAGAVTKELEVKLEPIEMSQITRKVKQEEQPNTEDKEQNNDEINESVDSETKEDFEIEVTEPESCVVNPNDDTLDDEEVKQSKSEGDLVIEEEGKLENFEKQDPNKHEEVIVKIKEAITKLEGGLIEIEKMKKVKQKTEAELKERGETSMGVLETPKTVNSTKLKTEVKPDDLKEALAQAAASIVLDENTQDKDKDADIPVFDVVKSRSKKDYITIKKAKKLRLLQEKKVKRQVEKVKSELEQMKIQFEAMRQHVMAQDYMQPQENAPLPESFLCPGEWCCRWVNGQPVGRVSEIEGAPQAGQDKPGLPRRSVQVEDKRLPPGWTKHMVRRSVGHSAGKWDVVLVSPDELGNKRFHTKTEMRNFLEAHKDESLKEYENALLDFGVHLKISRRMGWIVNTPDGIAEGPETILPAGTTCGSSPLVKRKTLSPDKRRLIKEKRALKIRGEKRKPIKIKLQKGPTTYNSQLLIGGESRLEAKPETTDAVEQSPMPLEDGYVYVGSLKVQIIENLLRCPAEGCFKNFRTKTLLQMHIKHYHRELKAMMGVTPKVVDLAYARQRLLPNKNKKEAGKEKRIIKVKINKPPKREEPRPPPVPSEPDIPMESPTTPVSEEIHVPPIIPKIPRSQDSPKLRQALIHKPVKRPRVLLPVRRPEPEFPEPVHEENFESQLLEPIMEIPALEQPLDFETAISTHTVTKPLEKKRKGDKKKLFASISKNISEDEEWFAMNSDDLDTMSSYPRSGSPDSKVETKLPPISSESNEEQKEPELYTYTETGERIKIVHMKREEIINCHCGVREEDGLMVQCELCLCWQHALCHNIQRESEVPEKYTCSICLNPRRGRRSKRFLHDQDRLYEGLLPGAKPCDSLRRSHELTGNLMRIDDALHALRVKFYVATKKDHPKLYLWAKDWEQAEISFTQEKLNSDYSDLNIMINGMDKENHPVADDGIDIRTPPSEEQESDRSSQRENQLGSQALLSGLLSSPGGASLDLPITSSELERLAHSVQECAEWPRAAAPAPQPEAAIENSACRERLLRHVQRCHALLDSRLDSIEAQVAELESQEPSFGEHYETAEHYPHTKQTIQMLMRDLDTLEELAVIT